VLFGYVMKSSAFVVGEKRIDSDIKKCHLSYRGFAQDNVDSQYLRTDDLISAIAHYIIRVLSA